MFQDIKGQVIPEASTSTPLASGVPGSVAGLAELHRKFGYLPFHLLLQPAIIWAERGFPLTSQQADELNENMPYFNQRNPHCNYFKRPDGRPWKERDTLKQPVLAKTLRALKIYGSKCFYSGWLADTIAQFFKSEGGIISEADLHEYKPVWRSAIKIIQDSFIIWLPPPPSAGGIAIAQMFQGLELVGDKAISMHNSAHVIQFQKLAHLAFRDRLKYICDPDFDSVPVKKLISTDYIRKELTLYQNKTLIDSAWGKSADLPFKESTTHFSIIDAEGGALSLTTTINDSYGSKIFVCGAGFLLNNEMDDFSIKQGIPNIFGLPGSKVNAIAPGKRMVSSMTPIIVTKNSKPFLVAGTPGGTTIISTMFHLLYWVLKLKQPIESFNLQKRFHYQAYPDLLFIEEGTFDEKTLEEIKKSGINLRTRGPIGRMDGLQIRDGFIFSAPDPRGNDAARGF